MGLRRLTHIAFKTEATAGVAETLAAADAGTRAYDGEVTLNTEVIERDRLGGLGITDSARGPQSTEATFLTYLHGRGSAGVPHHGQLWRACGFNLTGQQYTTSDNDADWRTLTIAEYRAGKRRIGRGMMGSAQLDFVAGRPVQVQWTFRGGYVGGATDTTLLSGVTYESPSAMPPRWAGAGRVTVDNLSTLLINQVTIDVGNEVVLRESANHTGGYLMGEVRQRVIRVTIDPEFISNATRNWWDMFRDGSKFDLECVVGAGANQTITVAVTNAELAEEPGFGDRGGRSTSLLSATATSLSITYS